MEKLKLISLDIAKLHRAEFGEFIIPFFEDFGKPSLEATINADFKVCKRKFLQ